MDSMTTITAHSRSIPRRKSGGFSLVEVMIAMSLGLVAAGAIMSSFIFMVRSSHSVSHYAEMNAESRYALEIIGRDLRNALDLASRTLSAEHVELLVVREDGSVEHVSYVLMARPSGGILVRNDAEGGTILMREIQEFSFRFYDLQGSEVITNPLPVKQVQVQVKLRRRMTGLDHTDRIVSARYIMRNKRVGE